MFSAVGVADIGLARVHQYKLLISSRDQNRLNMRKCQAAHHPDRLGPGSPTQTQPRIYFVYVWYSPRGSDTVFAGCWGPPMESIEEKRFQCC